RRSTRRSSRPGGAACSVRARGRWARCSRSWITSRRSAPRSTRSIATSFAKSSSSGAPRRGRTGCAPARPSACTGTISSSDFRLPAPRFPPSIGAPRLQNTAPASQGEFGMRRKKRSTIEDMMEEERPRERLLESGPGVLTDADLVAVLFGTGGPGEGVLELSARVTAALPLRQLHRVPVEELLQVKGMGHARAAQLLAAAELGRRLWPDGDAAALVRGPETVFDLTRDIRGANREHFVGFYLNSRNQVLRREIISIGSLNASIVHPRAGGFRRGAGEAGRGARILRARGGHGEAGGCARSGAARGAGRGARVDRARGARIRATLPGARCGAGSSERQGSRRPWASPFG